MGKIEDALAAINSLEPGEKLVYLTIAKQYGVSVSALINRHQGASTSPTVKAENQQNLHPH